MKSGTLRLRGRRAGKHNSGQYGEPSAEERNNRLAVWLGVIAGLAAAVAAGVGVVVAGQQEEATYKSIIVEREVDTAAQLISRSSAFLNSASSVRHQLDFYFDVGSPHRLGRDDERAEIRRQAVQAHMQVVETKQAIEQLQMLLPDDSEFLRLFTHHLDLLDIVTWSLVQRLNTKKKLQMDPEPLRRRAADHSQQVSADIHVFRTCARMFIAKGRPIDQVAFDQCTEHWIGLRNELHGMRSTP